MSKTFRDPIHGFIELTPLELKVVDSMPFQRLRNIKQLSLTSFVYHGAEHTRFGHSLGVMHLVTRAFRSVCSKGTLFDINSRKWYEQILRLIALTHDLGHAPFSHGSESLFPEGIDHEDYTERIVKGTEVGEIISQIGREFVKELGEDYDINPDLICSIYRGHNATHPDFIFLRKFMDSELDCDKMDYLLRDSYYCGVNYGKYDVERLISSLTYFQSNANLFLAIEKGGVHAFEEFVLARYFMFVQVYFHRTRRYFDRTLIKFLASCLPNGKYPESVDEFLQWDDNTVWSMIKESFQNCPHASALLNRLVMPMVFETPTNIGINEIRNFNLIKADLGRLINSDKIMVDTPEKLVHKIPRQYKIDDEKAIPIVLKDYENPSTISEQSDIINKLDQINIHRLYVDRSVLDESRDFIRQRRREMGL